MSNIKRFSSRKEVIEFLKEKEIDTSNWSEEKWLSLNKGQAEIHIQAIAELMWDAYNESTPKQLQADEWHIPFGDNISTKDIYYMIDPNYKEESYSRLLIKIATARCARISYQTLGDDPKIDYEADIRLHDMLYKSGHFSPFEHCAKATDDSNWYGNFRGWNQYRKMLEKNEGQ